MRLLITGGAGCLGSNLAERHLERGHDVLVLDNFVTGKRASLPLSPRLDIVDGSVADASVVRDCFRRFRPNCVIHSAAAYKDPSDWASDVETNVLGSINIARAAIDAGVTRLVNLQTALCYGRPGTLPIPIEHVTAPFTSYGISKTAGESYLLNSGAPVVSLRLANICGPRLAIGPIPTFYKRLKAGQACFCSDTVRDFLDMEDFFSLIDLVLAPSSPTGVFNVSTGEGTSIKTLFDLVAEHVGAKTRDVPIVPPGIDDVKTIVLDPSATETTFGWRAKHGAVETVRRQLAWYDTHGVTDVHSHLSQPVIA